MIYAQFIKYQASSKVVLIFVKKILLHSDSPASNRGGLSSTAASQNTERPPWEMPRQYRLVIKSPFTFNWFDWRHFSDHIVMDITNDVINQGETERMIAYVFEKQWERWPGFNETGPDGYNAEDLLVLLLTCLRGGTVLGKFPCSNQTEARA